MKRCHMTFIRRMETAAVVAPNKFDPLSFLQRERVKLNGAIYCQGGNIFHGMTGSVYGFGCLSNAPQLLTPCSFYSQCKEITSPPSPLPGTQ